MSLFITKETKHIRFGKIRIGLHFFDQWKKEKHSDWHLQLLEVGLVFYIGAFTVRLKLLGFCSEIFIIYQESDIPF